MNRFPTDLYLILDPSMIPDRDPLEAVQEAIAGGIRMIQYRDKRGSRRLAYQTARELLDLTRRRNAILIINDDVDLAMAVGADGVHLGLEDFPISMARPLLGSERIMGGSVHTLDQAISAQEAGADYLGIGPIFASSTKQSRLPLGCEILKEFRQKILIPVFAIGGISIENVPQVLSAGADGVACISAILNQPNVREATQRLLKTIRAFRQASS